MTIYNYYIDKRSKNKNDEFIDINLDFPIETTDYEYLKIKLCDFKFLNNIYNISQTLMNNQFNIRRYSKTYTFTYGSELYLTDTGFFDDQNALIVSEVIDVTLHKSTIAYDTTSLTYYNTADITDDTASYWENILNGTVDTNRKMKLHETYIFFIEIECTDKTITSFDCVFYKDTYVGGSTTAVDIVLQKYNTSNSIWEIINTNTITFANSVPEEQISSTFTITSPSANEKYRITSNTASLPFTLYILKLQADKQIPIFDTGTVDEPVLHTITIPDGFYKSSTYKNTLNDLLTNYKITTSIDTLNNKIKFTNDNITFVPTITDLIDDNFQIDLVIPNIPNMLENLGIINYQQYINIPFNSYYESDTHINLINLSKIIITTDLNFRQKTHNEIIKGNEIHRGFGNILAWIDTDLAPLTCITYRNYEDLSYKIENRHVSTIRLRFYNEKSQPLVLDNALIHLQINKLQKKSY